MLLVPQHITDSRQIKARVSSWARFIIRANTRELCLLVCDYLQAFAIPKSLPVCNLVAEPFVIVLFSTNLDINRDNSFARWDWSKTFRNRNRRFLENEKIVFFSPSARHDLINSDKRKWWGVWWSFRNGFRSCAHCFILKTAGSLLSLNALQI